MSWTSEHDPPASRPPDDGDSASAGNDIPEDGPLDPSVFDGLFDDLADDRPDEVDDNPLDEFLAVTLTGDLDDDLLPARDTDRTDPDEDSASGDEARDADGSFATTTDAQRLADDAVDADVAPLDREPEATSFVEPGLDGADLEDSGGPLPPAMPTRDDGEALDGFDEFDDIDRLGELADPPHGLADDDHLDEWLSADEAEADLVDQETRPELLPIDPDLLGPEEFEAVDEFDDVDELDDLDGFDDLQGLDDGMGERAGAGLDRFSPIPEEGPVRASPPIQHDPMPIPEVAAPPPVEEEPIPTEPSEHRTGRSRRVLLALAAAITVGGGLGVGGAMLLSRIIDRGDNPPTTAAATGTEENTETAAATEDAVPSDTPGPATSMQIASLRFDGNDSLDVESSPALELLATAIERNPTEPVVATVRTFTEATAADDLALSRRQAEALTTRLVEFGADPERVAVFGLGRSLLSGAQPVPNFVVPTAGLETSALAEVARAIGPFAIGLDPTTGQLRAESIGALDALAQALAADPDGRQLTLAAYNFDQVDRTANESQARLVGEVAAARLIEAGVDPTRLTTIVAGDEPFAVPDRVGNHIDLTWGTGAATPLAIGALPIDRVDFAEGSSDLGQEAATTIDQLAAVLIESGATAVIDVHSFDGVEVEERVDLSVARAQTIGQRLLGAGVPANQLRLHGGTSAQFRGEDRICRVVVTALQPPDRS